MIFAGKPCAGLSVFNYKYEISTYRTGALDGYGHDIYVSACILILE